MPTREKKLSPITGEEVPFTYHFGATVNCEYDHAADGLGDYKLNEALALNSRIIYGEYDYHSLSEQGHQVTYASQEVEAAFMLIRSYLWRQRNTQLKNLIVTDQNHYQEAVVEIEVGGRAKFFYIRTFEELIREAKTLTIKRCAMETLVNLMTVWQRVGLDKNIYIYGAYVGRHDSKVHFDHRKTHDDAKENLIGNIPEKYIAYGCNLKTSPFIYRYLLDNEFLSPTGPSMMGPGFSITSKGFDILDDIAKGKNSGVVRGFFVRRYVEDDDGILGHVMHDACTELGIEPIEPVWSKDHNEKIDERIFRQIREASVIVVDVTGERYNVGLEHGYAMALGKPIVLIREKPDPWVANPFDISTQNCYDYVKTEAGQADLKGKLIARIGVALDSMKSG